MFCVIVSGVCNEGEVIYELIFLNVKSTCFRAFKG